MTLPEDMDPVMRRIRALEKEVASLRGRNPLASATLDDDDGNRRVNFGRLPSGAFGFEVYDADGNTVFVVDETQNQVIIRDASGGVIARLGEITVVDGSSVTVETGISVESGGRFVYMATDDRGLMTPPPQYEWRRIQDGVAVTSGVFVPIWQSIPLFFTADALWITMALQSPDPSTTGEVRLELVHPDDGSFLSAVQTIPAGFNGYRTFAWDVGAAAGINPGEQINVFINAQVRRTAGTDNIYIYEPLPMLVRDHGSLGATPTGV